MAFAKGTRACYRAIALAASNELHRIAINGHNKASCKQHIAITTIESEKNSFVKKQTAKVNPFQTTTICELRVQIKKQLLLKQ